MFLNCVIGNFGLLNEKQSCKYEGVECLVKLIGVGIDLVDLLH